jgi:hypothetical protein
MASMMEGSRQTYTATLPPDRYHCVLDELPLHLVPRTSQRLLEEQSDRTLFLNGACMLRSAGDVPAEFRARQDLLSGFVRQGTIAWVPQPSGGMIPFWLGPALENAVRSLGNNEPAPESIPRATRTLLAAAGILVPVKASDANVHDRSIVRASASFRTKGYAPLSCLIHPFHVATLRRYYRHQIRSGKIELGDQQSSRRYIAHNEPVARFFHDHLASVFSAVSGTALKPSYVYLASYLSGAELKTHTDREQCDYSITLCLDFSPEPRLATPWPICLQTSAGTIQVFQALGDGLAYRGTRIPHFRSPLGQGCTSTSIFFHYVREDFAGSLD